MAELIVSARDQLESDTRRALITQTWRIEWPGFPSGNGPIETRKPPLQSVTKVDYIDEAGVSQPIDAGNYEVDNTREPGLIWPAAGYAWPKTANVRNAVQVTFVAGYGDLPGNMPGLVVHALKLLVTMQFSETETGAYERNAYETIANRLEFGQYP